MPAIPTPNTPAALHGLRVLDLSRVFSGPWTGQMLGDLGAEVVKVERPEAGDDSRRLAPFFSLPSQDAKQQDAKQSVFFASANRNKKSITVDIASKAGQRLIRALAAKSDVVIENYKVGTLGRYGLDYASLSAINPRLIYCSITGFGQTGPFASRPGYDLVFQAMSGLMSVTGSGESDGGPQRVGFVVSDFIGGMYASVSILAALQHRNASGAGQHIDLSLLDTQVAALSHIAGNYLMTGNIPGRHGTAAPQGAPSQMYRAADREIVVVVGNEEQFSRLCGVIGMPELASDARFCSNSQRLAHKKELNERLEGALMMRPADDWLAELERAGVPAGPVLNMQGMFDHPQIKQRGMKVEPGEKGNTLPHVASPINLSVSPVACYRDAPGVGANTDTVLADWLGLAADEIDALRSAAVI
jgi:crotonobetainyl-CoA:carnitine CoA-transferase CaiB-like acyl-CoA transferase